MAEISPLFLHIANNSDPNNDLVKSYNRSIILNLIEAIKKVVWTAYSSELSTTFLIFSFFSLSRSFRIEHRETYSWISSR